MATVTHYFHPEQAQYLATNFPQLVKTNGTNFPVSGLAYDGGSTDESAYFKFVATSYGSGNLTVTVYWYADTASSGNVVWGAAISAITPNTDSQDIETDAFATANTQQDAHLGTTGQRLHSVDITVSNLDSIAAGDHVFVHIYRDASDTVNDTMTGDAIITLVTLAYSDT